ncbi:MAG: hypothetical protein OT477_00970 [Chloroflexi bacterium]|nr:hypothetical protein [Chloroflexota bacterium]
MSLDRKRKILLSIGLLAICLSTLLFMYKYTSDEITHLELEELLGVSIPHNSEFLYRRCEHRSGVFEALNGDQVTINEQFIMFSGTLAEADNLAQALNLHPVLSNVSSHKLSPTTCLLDWWEENDFESAYYLHPFEELTVHPNLSECFYVGLAYKSEWILIQLTDMGHGKCGSSS